MRCIPFLFLSVLLTLGASARTGFWYALVLDDGYWKAIDPDGTVLADSLCRGGDPYAIDYRFYADFAEGLFPYRRDDAWGFKNHRNEVVIPCRYKDIGRRFSGGCIPVTLDAKWGLIDRQGKTVIPFGYDYLSVPDSLGLVIAHCNRKLTVFDTAGRIVVPPYYGVSEFLDPEFADGLMPVLVPSSNTGVGFFWHSPVGGKVGFINRKGELVIDTVYTLNGTVGDRRRELYPWKGCGSGLLQAREFAEAHPFYKKGDYYCFRNGRCVVMSDKGPLVIDEKGDSLFALPGHADEVRNYQGFISVRTDLPRNVFSIFPEPKKGNEPPAGPYMLYSPDGRLLMEGGKSVTHYEGEGLHVTDRNQRGFTVDTQGKLTEGTTGKRLAAVTAADRYWFAEGGKYGYKDAIGSVRIPVRYASVTNFRQAVAAD